MAEIHGKHAKSLNFSASEWRLLNVYQHHFPLESRPFLSIAEKESLDESAVLDFYKRMAESGVISRIGAVVKPNILGKSALIAMKIPNDKIAEVAEKISAFAEINHNYQRAHEWNLWFVAVSKTAESLDDFLKNLQRRFPFPLIKLPLVREFHIDLGFDLENRNVKKIAKTKTTDSAESQKSPNAEILKVLQNGIPLDSQPFHAIADDFGISESSVFAEIQNALKNGTLRRFGVVLRHLELGYNANAMCVWQIPKDKIAAIGEKLAAEPLVTLCYERDTTPEWQFNLYAMIHGKSRDSVQKIVAELNARHALQNFPSAILFHQKRFKQSGARYA